MNEVEGLKARISQWVANRLYMGGTASKAASAKMAQEIVDGLAADGLLRLPGDPDEPQGSTIIEALDLRTGGLRRVAAADSQVKVKLGGLAVTIYEHDGEVILSVDPINGEAIRLTANTINYSDMQFRAALQSSREV